MILAEFPEPNWDEAPATLHSSQWFLSDVFPDDAPRGKEDQDEDADHVGAAADEDDHKAAMKTTSTMRGDIGYMEGTQLPQTPVPRTPAEEKIKGGVLLPPDPRAPGADNSSKQGTSSRRTGYGYRRSFVRERMIADQDIKRELSSAQALVDADKFDFKRHFERQYVRRTENTDDGDVGNFLFSEGVFLGTASEDRRGADSRRAAFDQSSLSSASARGGGEEGRSKLVRGPVRTLVQRVEEGNRKLQKLASPFLGVLGAVPGPPSDTELTMHNIEQLNGAIYGFDRPRPSSFVVRPRRRSRWGGGSSTSFLGSVANRRGLPLGGEQHQWWHHRGGNSEQTTSEKPTPTRSRTGSKHRRDGTTQERPTNEEEDLLLQAAPGVEVGGGLPLAAEDHETRRASAAEMAPAEESSSGSSSAVAFGPRPEPRGRSSSPTASLSGSSNSELFVPVWDLEARLQAVRAQRWVVPPALRVFHPGAFRSSVLRSPAGDSRRNRSLSPDTPPGGPPPGRASSRSPSSPIAVAGGGSSATSSESGAAAASFGGAFGQEYQFLRGSEWSPNPPAPGEKRSSHLLARASGVGKTPLYRHQPKTPLSTTHPFFGHVFQITGIRS